MYIVSRSIATNVDGYEEYLKKHLLIEFQIEPMEEEEVVNIMKNQNQKTTKSLKLVTRN